MAYLSIIADDLTGAADAAAPFAAAGYATYVALEYTELPEADVLAVATESRHLDVDRAIERVRQVGRMAPAPVLLKKIDSTLRGHPVAELRALQSELGRMRTLIAPAFPSQGRTTVAGRQLLSGRPLEETPFRDETAGSDLLDLFAGADLIDLETVWDGESAVRRVLVGTTARTWVADAETDDDLSVLCAAAVRAGVDLFCGSGGLARALSLQNLFAAPQGLSWSKSSPQGCVLVVAGSRHPATLAQLTELERRGALVCDPDHMHEAVEALRQQRTVAIATRDWRGQGGGRDLAVLVAMAVRAVVEGAPVGGLVVTGGDIAAAVCRELGARGLWLDGEALPGMPLGRLHGGRYEGLSVATKAGGFGDRDALERLRYAVDVSLQHRA